MTKINVLTTGVGGGGVGEQILKCLKMTSLNVNLYGCDINHHSKGLKSVEKGFIVPPANDDSYSNYLIELCQKNNIKIIFPGSEPELKVISTNRELFETRGICIPLNSKELIDTCMDKNKTMQFLLDAGLCFPKFWKIDSVDKIDQIDIFPLVLKPSVGGGGSINTFIAQDKEELVTFATYLLRIYSEFVVQEYVGDYEHEYTIGIMCNSEGKYINSIAVKKDIMSGLSSKIKVLNRTGRSELGKYLVISSGISQGEIGRFEEVTIHSKEIAEKLHATASINIQCRLYEGEMYVFEINPRISGTASLRALVGYNEPEMLIRDRILKEKLEVDFKYDSGYITRGLDETFFDLRGE